MFATETLALGINMPARSVVIEKLVKWNGETHADITPGEYTQLTGRAGRRGIDVEGHGVVLWSPDLDPKAVAGLASTRTYPLRSSFRPSYNMAVNLVHQVGRATAREAASRRSRSSRPTRRSSGWRVSSGRPRRGSSGYAESADLATGATSGSTPASGTALKAAENRRKRTRTGRPTGASRSSDSMEVTASRRRHRGPAREVRRVGAGHRPRHPF